MNEIAYTINAASTREQECLVLDLVEAIREGSSYHLLPTNAGRSIAQWRALIKNEVEQDVFNFLLKEEGLFQQRRRQAPPPHLKSIHVAPSQIMRAFTLLAATQKVHCEGKQLIIDLFSPAEFYYEAASLPEERIEIEGRLSWRDKDIALSDCLAIGPGDPIWFVHGWLLKNHPSLFKLEKNRGLKAKTSPLRRQGQTGFLRQPSS